MLLIKSFSKFFETIADENTSNELIPDLVNDFILVGQEKFLPNIL